VEHPPAGGAGGLKSGPRRVCPSSTHGVDCLDDHPNLDFGAQHARYGFGVQPKSDRLLAVVLLIAIALGRIRITPLKSRHWFLLAMGLTQVPIWTGLVIVAWLLALGLRAKVEQKVSGFAFNAMQVALSLLTLLALNLLFFAVQQGLLGLPEMQIAGNNSTASQLNWYIDRSDARLPQAWVVSVPLFGYRVLMLAWALWLAFALLGWLKWGWGCFSQGGL
ncbi:MAG: hypothetical protein ACREUI_09430, partial [Burkholderiales bacterium]